MDYSTIKKGITNPNKSVLHKRNLSNQIKFANSSFKNENEYEEKQVGLSCNTL